MRRPDLAPAKLTFSLSAQAPVRRANRPAHSTADIRWMIGRFASNRVSGKVVGCKLKGRVKVIRRAVYSAVMLPALITLA